MIFLPQIKDLSNGKNLNKTITSKKQFTNQIQIKMNRKLQKRVYDSNKTTSTTKENDRSTIKSTKKYII